VEIDKLLQEPCAMLTAETIVRGLDDSHLVVWGHEAKQQQHASDLARELLSSVPEAQVVEFDGASMTDLRTARAQIDRALPDPDGRALGPSFDGPTGVWARLREMPPAMSGHHVKRRYYLWHDADTLLTTNPSTFSVIVETLAGVAAEAEFVSDDLLLIHRVLLIGGPELAACWHDVMGPLRAWRTGSPWSVMTKTDAPKFGMLRAC
jgi:hypothetical protein